MSKKYRKDYRRFNDWDCEDNKSYKAVGNSKRKIECKSNSNPYIIINNNSFRRQCEVPETPLQPPTSLLGETSGTFDEIGESFTLIAQILVVVPSTDPVLVSANVNWRPDGVLQPQTTLNGNPIAEFKLVREAVAEPLSPVDLMTVQAAAPAELMPTVTGLEVFDKDAPVNKQLLYKLYARVDTFTMSTMSPFTLMARQYAVAAPLD